MTNAILKRLCRAPKYNLFSAYRYRRNKREYHADDDCYKQYTCRTKRNAFNFDFAKQQYEDSKYVNAGGQYKVSKDENGNPVVTPDVEGTVTGQSIPSNVIKNVQNYTTQDGQLNYLKTLIDQGVIDDTQADQLMAQYGVVPLTERSWEMTNDGGWNLFGIDRNASVKDQFGNEYTLAELKKELKKTMTSSEATKYLKELQKQLGID